MKPLGVILAGGQARRMGGGDKCLLDLKGEPLLTRIAARLRPQVFGMVLNANGDPRRFGRFGLPIVADTIAGQPGPLAGVLAGLDHAAEIGADHILTVAGDTPFFPEDLGRRLETARSRAETPLALAGTEVAGRLVRHPTFGLWPVRLRHNLRSALTQGTRKIVTWTDSHGAATALFPDAAFFNINTPEDLAKAEARG